MDFSIEKNISNFISKQFPAFYQEEGPDFILFMQAYYEWLESDFGTPLDGNGGPIRESRQLYNYRDIDNTIEKFLEYFQKKYLYGIPFNIISNKRFLLKHILDVYRSKGTIQCYKLLFKLLYNEDVDFYIPGKDILRVSDGNWIEPKYLEISSPLISNETINNFVGKSIFGISSGVTAVVESCSRENYNNGIVTILHISNISPKGADFEIGEKIFITKSIDDISQIEIDIAPTIIGSLDKLTVINGGQGYKIGDVIKIVHRDVSNGDVISFGVDGILKVTELSAGFGSLNFNLISGGFGFTSNASTFVYRNGDNGESASFQIATILSSRSIPYNTDLICDYLTASVNSVSYQFPANTSANSQSLIGDALSFQSQIFGTIFSFDNIETGTGYDLSANVFVRSTQLSKSLGGTISYNTTSNTITGTSTNFDYYFENNDIIAIQANSTLDSSFELAVIKQVVSNVSILLYGPPTKNSTVSAFFKAAPTILPSQYATYESEVVTLDGSLAGENENISAVPNTGNNIVSAARALNSGKGYIEDEEITAYLYGSISNNILIIESGTGYTNNDLIVFAEGDGGVIANGYILTDNTGAVISTNLVYGGSGYTSIPTLKVQSNTGSGAQLTATIQEFNTTSPIFAKVNKRGIGKGRGFWATTKGFLSSDKYIQDSYYYQDYSYEIRVAKTLSDYKDIIYNTFHVAGAELFGKYLLNRYQSQKVSIVSETEEIFSSVERTVDSGNTVQFLASTTIIRADVDNNVKVDSNIIKSDSVTLTADRTFATADRTSFSFSNYLSADNITITVDNRKRIYEYITASSTKFKSDNNKSTVSRYFV